jgi:hypothetical protein
MGEAMKEAEQEFQAHPLLAWFGWEHLPEDLATTSKAFFALALAMDRSLPNCAEKTVALRKLLESKDAAVRATIEARPE